MRRLIVLGGLAFALLLVLVSGAMTKQAVAGPDDVTVAISGVGTRADITYSIVVSNKGTAALGDIYVAGAIPSGATFDSVVTTPAGASSLGAQGSVVAWLVGSIPANGSVTLSYKVKGTTIGAANAYAGWKAPSAGSAVSASVTQAKAQEDGGARRGCMACHYSVTLWREAETRGGPNHPKLTNDATVYTCLGCHKASADRTGIAPKMLRTIVHPAHMYSDSFKTRYNGTCFTCHDVDETGKFILLYDKVVPNKYNVPENVNAKGFSTQTTR